MKTYIFVALTILTADAALAQAPSCRTQGTITCAPKVAASLIGANGNVSVLRQSASLPGAPGSVLVGGDRVVTLEGSAVVGIGPNCRVPLGQNASAQVYTTETETCVSFGQRAPVAAAATGSAGVAGSTGAVLGGVAAAGGLAAIALGAGNRSSTPRLSP